MKYLAFLILGLIFWIIDKEFESKCYVAVLTENRISDDGNINTDIIKFVSPDYINQSNIDNMKILKVERGLVDLYYGRTIIRTLNNLTGNITYGDNGYIMFLSNEEMKTAFEIVEKNNIF